MREAPAFKATPVYSLTTFAEGEEGAAVLVPRPLEGIVVGKFLGATFRRGGSDTARLGRGREPPEALRKRRKPPLNPSLVQQRALGWLMRGMAPSLRSPSESVSLKIPGRRHEAIYFAVQLWGSQDPRQIKPRPGFLRGKIVIYYVLLVKQAVNFYIPWPPRSLPNECRPKHTELMFNASKMLTAATYGAF